MYLTSGEREFLAVFIGEATTDPFNGPATSELHRRDIYYTDIPQLLTAYYREGSNEQHGLAGKTPHDASRLPLARPSCRGAS